MLYCCTHEKVIHTHFVFASVCAVKKMALDVVTYLDENHTPFPGQDLFVFWAWASLMQCSLSKNTWIDCSRPFFSCSRSYPPLLPSQVWGGHKKFAPQTMLNRSIDTQPARYVDDQLFCQRTKWTSDLASFAPYRAPFDTEFELLLNLAVGGSLPGRIVDESAFPATMLVDYVRCGAPLDAGGRVGAAIAKKFADGARGGNLR